MCQPTVHGPRCGFPPEGLVLKTPEAVGGTMAAVLTSNPCIGQRVGRPPEKHGSGAVGCSAAVTAPPAHAPAPGLTRASDPRLPPVLYQRRVRRPCVRRQATHCTAPLGRSFAPRAPLLLTGGRDLGARPSRRAVGRPEEGPVPRRPPPHSRPAAKDRCARPQLD